MPGSPKSPVAQPVEQSGRKYRSKKQRPCDLCRSRKIHCKIQGQETICELCKRLKTDCTFVLQPLRRRHRPGSEGENGRVSGVQLSTTLARDGQIQHTSPGQRSLASNGAIPARDSPSFWLMANNQATPSYPMDWTTMEFPIDDLSHNQAPHDQSDIFMSDALQGPMANADRNGLQAGANGSSYGQGADFIAEAGFYGFPQRATSSSNAETVEFEIPQGADWPVEFSLESKKGFSNNLIGLSSESDPFVLRYYLYDTYDTHPMFRLHFRKMVDDERIRELNPLAGTGQSPRPAGPIPVQIMLNNDNIWNDSVKAVEKVLSGSSTEKDDVELLAKLVPDSLGSRLIRLYAKFIHPHLPVLALSDFERLTNSDGDLSNPIGIRSAVYALAGPFAFLDDELCMSNAYLQVPAEELWAIAHRSYQRASQLSHISLLQLCILLLQRPPPNFAAGDPPSLWALSCSTLAIAENLGLNLDPSDWRLPQKEIMLRRRLWWFTYVQHTWHALVTSRPSHIHDETWDVAELNANDFEGAEHSDPEIRDAIVDQVPICLAQCKLSVIAADVLREFYTLKANRDRPSLTTLLNRAQPLRTRIESWRQTLPLLSKPASKLDADEIERGALLRMSHLTVEILIFRALLRPLLYQAVSAEDSSKEPISTILENCYTCAKVGTEIVSGLGAKHFASWWPPYVRYQLCYISTFILLNFAQSPTAESASRHKALLHKWRDTLRTQSRAWPLARLATVRLDAVFWKGLPSAIHEAGSDSPAVTLLKEQAPKAAGD